MISSVNLNLHKEIKRTKNRNHVIKTQGSHLKNQLECK